MKGDNSLRFEEWPNTTKRCVHITLFIITPITDHMLPLVEQEMLTLSELQRSPTVFIGIHVTRSLDYVYAEQKFFKRSSSV